MYNGIYKDNDDNDNGIYKIMAYIKDNGIYKDIFVYAGGNFFFNIFF